MNCKQLNVADIQMQYNKFYSIQGCVIVKSIHISLQVFWILQQQYFKNSIRKGAYWKTRTHKHMFQEANMHTSSICGYIILKQGQFHLRITVYMYFFSIMTSNYIKTYLLETYISITSSFWFWTPHPPKSIISVSNWS